MPTAERLPDEIHDRYSALRADFASGQAIAVLHIGASRTVIAVGRGSQPQATWTLDIGSRKIANAYFKRALPAPEEIEAAIVEIEDEISRARPLFAAASTVLTNDADVRDIALAAGVGDGPSIMLTVDAVERTFERLVATALRQLGHDLPQGTQFAATLTILRELMHHLKIPSITVRAE
jgi:exopolyphosphatase/pppGpp-phosphohydrolase